jgi:two-component system chemotaxis response regulator CheY
MALRRNLSILVVDDMTVSRQILAQALERFGVRDVAVAGDTEEALARLRLHRADLVIADLNMPGRDGVALLEELRATPRSAAMRFILTSALDASPRFDIARRLGIDGILVKPFDTAALLAAVEDVAGRI